MIQPLLEVPQPVESPTPVVPDAPTAPIAPDPGTPADPADPPPGPTPDEPATPINPDPGNDLAAQRPLLSGALAGEGDCRYVLT